MQTPLPQSPVIPAKDLDQLGPVRLLYATAGDEAPLGLTRVPIVLWIARAKENRSGLDDLAFLQDEIGKLGIGVLGEAPGTEPEPTIDVNTLHAKTRKLTLENRSVRRTWQ